MRILSWIALVVQALAMIYLLFWTDGRELAPRLFLLLLGITWLWYVVWIYRTHEHKGPRG